MNTDTKIKGRFYPLKHSEVLAIAHNNLTRFEIVILYYIRTLDPYSNGIEINASQIAAELSTPEKKVCRQTVSRALKRLDSLKYVELEVVRAVVRLSGKGELASDGDVEHSSANGCDKDSAPTHHRVRADTTGCVQTPQGAPTHHEVRTDTSDIYINRACAKIFKTDQDQTDNSACFENSEPEEDFGQDVESVEAIATEGSIYKHGTEKVEERFRRPPTNDGLDPWYVRDPVTKAKKWDSGFVAFYRQYLQGTPRYIQSREKVDEGMSKRSLNNLTRTSAGLENLKIFWEDFIQKQAPAETVTSQINQAEVEAKKDPVDSPMTVEERQAKFRAFRMQLEEQAAQIEKEKGLNRWK